MRPPRVARRRALVLAGAASALVAAAVAPAIAQPLTLDAALALALERHPSLAGARARVAAAQVEVDRVDVEGVPTVTVAAGYDVGARFPDRVDEPEQRAAVDVIGGWRIWDFGRRRALRAAARAGVDASRQALTRDERQVMLDVELAYVGVIGARARAEVTDAAVLAERRHLEEAERFVTAGTRTAIDVAQARARLARATVAKVRADNAIAIAHAELERRIGAPLPPGTTVPSTWPGALPDEDATTETLLAEAFAANPDVAVVAAERRAAELAREGARRSTRPVLEANAIAGVDALGPAPIGTADERVAPRWSLGLVLSWQLFDGGATAAEVRAATAALREVEASHAQLRLELRFQVDAARLGVTSAKAARTAVAESLVAAAEQVRLAEARFRAGLGTSTELADAQDALTLAQGDAADAALELARARAQLRHVLGRR